MGTPIELVGYDSRTGKFNVGELAISTLRKCKGPVAVVAVCGRARQGKSFILNQLLQQTSGGFQVAPTHRPCTKGLWMWSAPQSRTSVDGRGYHLVMLDTEGIDAYDQTTQYSTQIFSLAVLLSSLFVYNQMGGIDEAALDKLSLVTQMTKRIRLRADSAVSDAGELAGFTPSFLWLLRDFYLTLEEDGKKITPRDYLETALMPVGGSGAAVGAKNQIRESIKALFPDRQCFALVRPMHDEKALVNMDRTPASALRPEFRQGVEQLTQMIFGKALPKRVGAQVVTGPLLAGLLVAYVDAINGGAVPTIATAFQGVAEAECRRAVDAGEAQYCASFREGVAPEELELEREHQRAYAEAVRVFEDAAVGEGEVRAAHQRRLQEVVGQRFAQVKGRRLAEASAGVNDLLLRMNSELTTALSAADPDAAAVLARVEAMVKLYREQAAGPTKWQRLAEFLTTALPAAMQQLARRGEEAREREAARLAAALSDAQRCTAQAEAAAKEAAARHLQGGQAVASLKAALEDRSCQVAALEGQMRDMCAVSERKVQAAEGAAEARLASCQAEFEAAAQQLQARVGAAEVEKARLQTQVETLGSRCHTLQGAVDTLQVELGQLQHRCSSAMSDKGDASLRAQQLEAEVAGERARRQAAEAQWRSEAARAAELAAEVEGLRAERRGQEAKEEAMLLEASSVRRLTASRALRPAAGDGDTTADQRRAGAAGCGAGAAGSSAEGGRPGLDAMTMDQIKALLLEHEQEDAVWQLANTKPAPKKRDWVALAGRLLGGA